MRGFQVFSKLAAQNDICFADTWKIDIDHPSSRISSEYEDKLRGFYENKQYAKALVLYLSSSFAHRIFAAIKNLKLENHFILIGSDGWGSRFISQKLGSVAEGAIATHPIHKEFPGFGKHFFGLNPKNVNKERNPWFDTFWEFVFKCKISSKNCSENHLSSRIEGTEFGYMHFVRDAVFAYGEALKLIYFKICDRIRAKGVCFAMKKLLRNSDSTLLIDSLKNSSFGGVDGQTVKFVNGHDGAPVFSVMKYIAKNGTPGRYIWKNVATISADHSEIQWVHNDSAHKNSYPESVCGRPCGPGQTRRYHRDKCCWRCEVCEFPTYKFNESSCATCHEVAKQKPPFYQPNFHKNACDLVEVRIVGLSDPFIVAVASFAGLGLLLSALTLGLFVYYASTPIIKASSRELSVVLLIGILLCYGNVFLVILRPNIYSCAFIRFLYSVSYTVCYAAIFIKTNRIARIFRISKKTQAPKRTKYISPMSQLLLCSFIVGFQCILSTVWLALRKPTPDYKVSMNYEEKTISSFYFCEAFEDEDMIIALVVPVLLLILSAIYAFKARKCPGKFNETKYIIITTYTTCVVWFAFILVFFTTEKIPLRVFALCAGQAMNATVTLFCLFMPKLYVALCRPHKNTKDAVMGRKSLGSLGSWVARKYSTGLAASESPRSRKCTAATAKSAGSEISENNIQKQHEMEIFSESDSSESDSSPENEADGEKRALSKARRRNVKNEEETDNNNIEFADESD